MSPHLLVPLFSGGRLVGPRVFVCLLVCLDAGSAFAQGQWVPLGPDGGSVTAVVVDPRNPSIVYAGLPQGVYRSADAGGSWTNVSNGLTNPSIQRLAIDPLNPSTLYALALGGEVFRTTSAGENWNPASGGLPAVDPSDITIPYSLVIDPVTPSTLYMSTRQGVYRTTNSAGAWTRVDSGLPAGESGFIYSLAIHPFTHSTLYAGGPGRVFRSTDAGVTWQQISTNLHQNAGRRALAIDPMVPTTLYYAGHELTSGGVWRSLDGGVTWTHQLGGQVGPLAIDPATPSTVYAGTFFSGVWKSTDGGSTWVQADSGLDPEQIGALAIDPQLPTRLYAGLLGGEGLFRSDNAAVSWAPANHGLFAAPVRGLKADPVTPSTVYAMVAKDWDKPIGLTRSNDMGATWTRLLLAPFDLAINPISPSTMYAAATFGVYRTTDGGTTWLPVNNGISLSTARSVAIDPLTPSTVYAATSDAIYRSTNGGDSWTNSSAGLPAGAFQSRSVRLVIDPQTPSTLYLSGAAVYRTVNGGDSWTEVSNGLAGVFPSALAINPLTPSTLYLGTVFDGVFRTTNGGGTWTPVGAGLPTAYITSLALDPSNPSTIYVATAFRILGVPAAGVFRSTDSGMTWTAMSAGLTDLSVGALAIDPLTPSILYAGTDFRSTFRWQPEGVRRLGVIKGGTGSGTVTSTTAGIQCGPDCVQEYPIGALVTLNPVALPPSTFVSFGGDPDCADGVITMADNRTCTAVFNLPSYTLTVTKAGAGSGTVTSSVPGIDCGTDCAEPYTLGTVVTLTALPTTGSAFAGWSGGCSGIAQTCQVTMTQASSVTAAFGVGPPVAFSKGSPFNGQNLFGNIGVPMGWQVAGGADSYEYCIDTINNNSCDGGWIATVTTDARTGALLGATTYYWQVRAFNAAGTTEANSGTWWTFRTPDTGSPQVFTGVATGLGGMAATLNGTANPRGTTATGFFEYGATTTYGSTTAVASLGSGGSSVAIGNGNITGLTCNTVYHFRAGATNLMGTNYGSDVTFTTTPAGCPFTDSELTPGTTLMKAVHIIELRVRIDLLRTRQGLPAFNWTDTSLLAGVTAIRAVHFVELRAALAAVYAAAGRAVPIYTDADLRAGTTAKGVHILEIRSAVVALE